MAYVICFANEEGSDWEVVDGEDEMNIRVGELEKEGYKTILTFDEDDELDSKK
jgi:hypothetical protein